MTPGNGWRRFGRLWRADSETEIEDELEFHLEMKEQELMARGTPAERAPRDAADAFGDRARIERELRDIGHRRQRRARRAGIIDEVRTDLLQGWRAFARRPGIPLLVILLLALGIGAGTAVFSLVDAVVLNPIAVDRPDELLVIQDVNVRGTSTLGFSYPMLRALRAADRHVVGVAGHLRLSVGARMGDHAEQTAVTLVTGNYFELLGVRPQHGRMLGPMDEGAPGASPFVVVSDGFWRRVLGADPGAVGATVYINDAPLEVIGVAPPRFRGTALAEPVDLWIPLTMVQHIGRGALWSSPDLLETWYFTTVDAFARLRPGSSQEAAVTELAAYHAAAMEQRPPQEFQLAEDEPRTIAARSFRESAAARNRADLLRFLRVLGLVVGVCLAIACVNVASLMMIRATERTADMTVRAALGATRRRLFRQLLLESLVLGVVAGAAGIAVAAGAVRALAPFSLPGGLALGELSLSLNWRVLAVTALLSLACSVAFGLAPAYTGARAALMDALRRSAHGARRRVWRGGGLLVGVQIALALVLVVSSGLLIRSLREALAVDPGFRTEGMAALAVGLEQHGYSVESATQFVRDALDDIRSRPGVTGAAAASRVPVDADALRFFITPKDSGERERLATVSVTPDWFDLFGIPLLHGRGFTWADRADAPRVAIVTAAAARTLWPDGQAVGREIVVMFGTPYTVVGVIADAHFTRLSGTEPHVFVPLPQTMNLGAMGRTFLVAQAHDGAHALAAMRAAVRAQDPRIPTFRERDLQDQLDLALMPQRFGALLLATFGIIALLIAAIGIYAVASYQVARRRRELGIRAALGASGRSLTRSVLGRSVPVVLTGIAGGLVLAAVATRSLESILFGVAPLEPASYVGGAVVLGAVAILASWLPARRAARVDPMTVIREQG